MVKSAEKRNKREAPYVKQCREKDPRLTECLTSALHHLKPYLARGIPEIEMPSVEPFRMDELSLSLSSGPGGYRISLKDLDIYGTSNFTAHIHFPNLRIHARYTSSGVLIILPASGTGSFHADFGDVDADMNGKVISETRDGKVYLKVVSLEIDINIKRVRMQVKKIFNNNRILSDGGDKPFPAREWARSDQGDETATAEKAHRSVSKHRQPAAHPRALGCLLDTTIRGFKKIQGTQEYGGVQ
ncbi:hypothetical protein J437_LFUL015815 [Ladona fulva]|uniref:Uncharacterized protein n=1 Tax=Ladona fulva TaxID=123851 RepID=A0A8K0KI87_LADFU|nr:hypothetical protein J437_LFUL015815 [Ladona fulva]